MVFDLISTVNVSATIGNVKTLVTHVKEAIAKKDTLKRVRLEFVGIISS